MMELKIVLAMVVQHYRLRLHDRTKINFGGAMLSEPRPGMPVIIGRQDGSLCVGQVRGSVREVVEF